MLPSSFDYHRPATLDEALSLLATHGDDAKVLAGGQSLIPIMKLRFASPAHLIDINRIDGPRRHRGARREPADRRARPAQPSGGDRRDQRPLPDDRGRRAADRRPAGPEPRDDRRVALARGSRPGTSGSVMLALGASVVLKSSTGEREVPIGDFLVDTFQTSIAPERDAHRDPRAGVRAPARAART